MLPLRGGTYSKFLDKYRGDRGFVTARFSALFCADGRERLGSQGGEALLP